jgi:hypothetical protein
LSTARLNHANIIAAALLIVILPLALSHHGYEVLELIVDGLYLLPVEVKVVLTVLSRVGVFIVLALAGLMTQLPPPVVLELLVIVVKVIVVCELIEHGDLAIELHVDVLV